MRYCSALQEGVNSADRQVEKFSQVKDDALGEVNETGVDLGNSLEKGTAEVNALGLPGRHGRRKLELVFEADLLRTKER